MLEMKGFDMCFDILTLQGSEELFSINPLPPRSNSNDSTNEPTAYIPHSQPLVPNVGQESASRDREEDELVSAGAEEVCWIHS